MGNEEFDLCMSRIRSGDKDALHQIYNAYAGYLFHLVLAIVGSYEDAEDITSNLFIRIWKQADRYIPGNGHRQWLSRIAHNAAIDHLRTAGREIPTDYTEDPEKAGVPAPVQEDIAEEVVASVTVEQILSRLKPSEREIVHLKIIGEQTFERIAEILSMPLGTVTWRYRQAMNKLRRYGYEA
ncbi:MAG: RNA polymerase sigma factor [Blautia sp.]|nr:RNA polymerase sigma factor [Blautia sp.]